jgi:MFS transporter, DHA2 family, multidrug resistance protein
MNDPKLRRWWALGAVMLSVMAVGLDATVLSVALPTLAADLKASETDLQWFASGFMLVLAAAMLPAGLIGDRYGRKRLMIGALILFGAGSVSCAFAPTAAWFIAARFVLGAAGAALVVMALSALTVLFDEKERPRAVGIWAAANFIALPLGPILGGWLLTHYWWGWVFLINVPVALVGLIAVLFLVPESRSSHRPGIDLLGMLASSAGLVCLTYGFIEAGVAGWTDVRALLPMAGGVVVLAVFAAWERHLGQKEGGEPLIDLALFRIRSFTWGLALAGVGGLAMIGVLFSMPQYFQAILGTDPMGSGLRLLPMIGGLVLGAVPADRVVRVIGVKFTAAAGFAILCLSMLMGSRTGIGSSTAYIALWMGGVGLGMGLALSTASSAALSELSSDRAGVGSAVFQAFQKVGGPFGAAILGSVLAATYRTNLNLVGLPPAAAEAARASVFGGVAIAHRLNSPALFDSVRGSFVQGIDASILVSAGIAALGLVLTLLFLPSRRDVKAVVAGPNPTVAVRS